MESEAKNAWNGFTVYRPLALFGHDLRHPAEKGLQLVHAFRLRATAIATHSLNRTEVSEVFEKYIPKFEYELVSLRDYSFEDLAQFGDALSLLMQPHCVRRSCAFCFRILTSFACAVIIGRQTCILSGAMKSEVYMDGSKLYCKKCEYLAKPVKKRICLMVDEMPLACTLFDPALNLVQVNQEALRLFEAGSATEYAKHLQATASEQQPDGRTTGDKLAENAQEAVRIGEVRFSLILKTLGGKPMPSEVVMRRIDAVHATYVLCAVFDMSSLSHMLGIVEQLEKLAYTDPLTGAHNRRFFIEEAELALQTCVAEGTPFSIVMADIDHFKSINDKYGHSSGDEVLKIFVSRIRSVLRDVVVARLGGEEFMVLLPGFDADAAEKIAFRIQKNIESSPFYFSVPDKDDKVVIDVTASFGVASLPESHVSIYTVMERADAAMYKAKAAGRNLVVRYAPLDD